MIANVPIESILLHVSGGDATSLDAVLDRNEAVDLVVTRERKSTNKLELETLGGLEVGGDSVEGSVISIVLISVVLIVALVLIILKVLLISIIVVLELLVELDGDIELVVLELNDDITLSVDSGSSTKVLQLLRAVIDVSSEAADLTLEVLGNAGNERVGDSEVGRLSVDDVVLDLDRSSERASDGAKSDTRHARKHFD